jgi:hypothetical protein
MDGSLADISSGDALGRVIADPGCPDSNGRAKGGGCGIGACPPREGNGSGSGPLWPISFVRPCMLRAVSLFSVVSEPPEVETARS